jgi:ParB family chromosome partitioning protein
MPQEFSMLKDRLSSFLNAKVSLSCSSKGKGKISIPFNSEETWSAS